MGLGDMFKKAAAKGLAAVSDVIEAGEKAVADYHAKETATKTIATLDEILAPSCDKGDCAKGEVFYCSCCDTVSCPKKPADSARIYPKSDVPDAFWPFVKRYSYLQSHTSEAGLDAENVRRLREHRASYTEDLMNTLFPVYADSHEMGDILTSNPPEYAPFQLLHRIQNTIDYVSPDQMRVLLGKEDGFQLGITVDYDHPFYENPTLYARPKTDFLFSVRLFESHPGGVYPIPFLDDSVMDIKQIFDERGGIKAVSDPMGDTPWEDTLGGLMERYAAGGNNYTENGADVFADYQNPFLNYQFHHVMHTCYAAASAVEGGFTQKRLSHLMTWADHLEDPFYRSPELYARSDADFKYTVTLFETAMDPAKAHKFFKDISVIHIADFYDRDGKLKAVNRDSTDPETSLYALVESWSGKSGENDVKKEDDEENE